jgi:CBS domain-containing protein
MTVVDAEEFAEYLGAHPPFDSLDRYTLQTVADAAQFEDIDAGTVILDAFSRPTNEVLIVLAGRIDLWNDDSQLAEPPDEQLGPGSLFGFSAMLTERPVGPLAVAAAPASVARIPGRAVLPAFASARGARFLAGEVTSAIGRVDAAPSFGIVDELIVRPPLMVEPDEMAGDVAAKMTSQGYGYAAVRLSPGRFGLVTDPLLRKRILVEGLPATTTAAHVMESSPPTAHVGDSAAEALILMLDREADFVLVADGVGGLRGVVSTRDFAVSPTTAGASLHERLRRAGSVAELEEQATQMPATLGELMARGLPADKVIAVYSALRDAVVRRAISLVFTEHPDLSVDAFTWLSLGSNGRGEAVMSSDMDSAAAFDNGVSASAITTYRAAFAEINDLLARAGLSSDEHGASTQRPFFARTNADWRAAGREWLASPAKNQGAIMTSLMVDGRPIHGDPGLPAVTRVFGELRRHPQTMRLLLQESLSRRAKLRSVRDVLARRSDTFDLKTYALLPITNIARWAALSVGSSALPTIERLRVASGSAILPTEQAETLIEVFDVLQRLRLLSQLEQRHQGEPPSDVLQLDRGSPLDRSVIAQAVREIAAVQRRMDNVAAYVPTDDWSSPEPH